MRAKCRPKLSGRPATLGPAPGRQPGRRRRSYKRREGPSRPTASVNLHILEIAGLVVDADARGGDPAGVLAGLVTGLHQGIDELHVRVVGQPGAGPDLPLLLFQNLARGAHAMAGEFADLAVEPFMRLHELEGDSGLLDHLVPAIDAALAVGDVIVEQTAVDRA